MNLRVRRLGGAEISVDISEESTVAELKVQIESQIGVAVDQQRILFHGRVLIDDQSLRSYGISNDSVIHLVSQQPPPQTMPQPQTGSGTTRGPTETPRVRVTALPSGGTAFMTSMAFDGDQPPNLGAILGSLGDVIGQGMFGTGTSNSGEARSHRAQSIHQYNQGLQDELRETERIIESGLASLNISSSSENSTTLMLSRVLTSLSQLVSLDPDGTIAMISLRRLQDLLPRIVVMMEQRVLRTRLEQSQESFLHPAPLPSTSNSSTSPSPLRLIIDVLNRLPEDATIVRGPSSIHFSNVKVKQVKDILLKKHQSNAIPQLQVALVSWMESFALGRLERHVVEHLANRQMSELFHSLPSDQIKTISTSTAIILQAAVNKIPSEFYHCLHNQIVALSKNTDLVMHSVHLITTMVFDIMQPALDQAILQALGINDDRKRPGEPHSDHQNNAKIHKKD